MIALLKRGQIGFATNKHSQISKLIRWVTRSPWSHAFLIADKIEDRVYLLEANEFGTEYRLFNEYSNKDVVPVEIWEPISPEVDVSQAVEDTSDKFLGMMYGYLEFISIGFKILARNYLGIKYESPIHQGAICSQVVAYYVRSLHPSGYAEFNLQEITPAELYDLVTTSGLFRKIV